MTPSTLHRAAIYARVSTLDQEPENQLAELRRYVAARAGQRSSSSIGASVVLGTVAQPWMPF